MNVRTTTTAATIMLLAAGHALAQSTIRVPADAPTIQSAIDRAADGDTILVSAGRYGERLSLDGLSVTLRGEDGAGATVLDGSGLGAPVLTAVLGAGDAIALEGFTITGATAFGGAVKVEGGAITVSEALFEANAQGGLNTLLSAVTLSDVDFVDNAASNGGAGVYVLGGSLTIDGARFRGNLGRGLGGALYVGHARLDARGIEAVGNGMGEVLPDGSTRHFSTLGGGAIYTTGVSGRIDGARLVGNTAAFGGGLYVAGDGTLTVVNTLVSGSLTGLGAIYANASAPVIVNCTIVDNDDWGLFGTRGSAAIVRNSIFSGNEVDHRSIEIGGPGVADVAFTLVNGTAAATLGAGIVSGDPMLDDGFAPMPGSAAIDAGDNAAVPAGVTRDLIGGARFVDDPATPDTGAGAAPIVDLGAVEFWPGDAAGCAADLDGDGVLTVFDFLAFQGLFAAGDAGADLDGDGELTVLDFLAFQNAFDAGCP